METYDLTLGKNTKLVYKGSWTHENGQSMFVYQRSMSTTEQAGSQLMYAFKGTGLEILAGTFDKAKLRVTVDGEVYKESVKTQEAGNMNMIYSLSGLEFGEHIVTLELVKGIFRVDMVGVLGDIYK